MATRNRLLTRAQIHGAVRDPGYIFTLEEGELGPHRTVVASNHGSQITDHINGTSELIDVPLYTPIDDEIEKEREELHKKHAEERAALDRDPEREALLKKQREENAALQAKARKRALELKHEHEDAALKERQRAEHAAFEARASAEPVQVAPPRETKEEDLTKRHEIEAKALADKHATEQAALEGKKPEEKKPEEKKPELSPGETVDNADPPPVRDPPPNPPLPHPAPPKMPV